MIDAVLTKYVDDWWHAWWLSDMVTVVNNYIVNIEMSVFILDQWFIDSVSVMIQWWL